MTTAGAALVASTLVAAVVCGVPARAEAQPEPPLLRPRHVSILAGITLPGGYAIGDQTAELRRNTTPPASPFPLFAAESELGGELGFDARVEFALTRSVSIEVGGTYSTPALNVEISGDVEAGTAAAVTDIVSRYTVDVNGLWHLPFALFGGRSRPYVIAGGGYLRELHEDRLIVETGRVVHAGAGLRYWFRGADGTRSALGVRGEIMIARRTGGIEFEERARVFPAASVLGVVGF